MATTDGDDVPRDLATAFATRLRQAREIRGLDQGALSERAQVSATTLSHFESGRREPSLANLRRLVKALDVSADYLLGLSSQPRGVVVSGRLFAMIQLLETKDRDLVAGFVALVRAWRKEIVGQERAEARAQARHEAGGLQ